MRVINIPNQFVVVHADSTPTQTSEGHIKEYALRVGYAEYVNLSKPGAISRESTTFSNCDDWWNWLYAVGRIDRPLYVFSANCSVTMRLLGLLIQLDNERLGMWPRNPETLKRMSGDPLLILEATPFIVNTWDVRDRKIIILDTKNYFDLPISELASSVGLSPPLDLYPPDVSDTCNIVAKRHVEINKRMILRLIAWVRKSKIGSFGYTVAGQALLAWKRKHGKDRIVLESNPEHLSWERKALYAGRTTVFKPGKHHGPMHHVDVTSFYPSLMWEYKFPCALESTGTGDDLDKMDFNANPINYIADVTIDTPSSIFPRRVRSKVFYEMGKFRTMLAGPELHLACRSRRIYKVHTWARYDIDCIFVSYIDEFWELRKKAKESGDAPWDYFAKRMMNSLFGKFAQRDYNWVDIAEPWWMTLRWGRYNIMSQDGSILRVRAIAGRQQVLRGRKWPPHAFPAIAAYVTSYGRLVMNGLRNKAGQDNVFYQGVDSLFLNEAGWLSLSSRILRKHKELGHLRLHSSAEYANFAAEGVYQFGDNVVCCGKKPWITIDDSGRYNQIDFESLGLTLHDPHKTTVLGTKVSRKVNL